MANYFTDRVVEHPGRVGLAPVSGEANQYDMSREEGTVTEAGTPFSADAFNTMLDKYGVFYGTCSTSGSASVKSVTCPGFVLEVGATICVNFTNRNTNTGTTYMNVNSTGAEEVRGDALNGGNALNVAGAWLNNDTKLFVYDGTYWQLLAPNFITGDQLSSVESVLGLSAATGRLFNILNAMANFVVAPMDVTSPTGSGSVGANTGANIMVSMSKSGYYPIGIIGYSITGDGSGYADARQYSMTERSTGSGTARFYVWNNSTSQKTWTVTAQILWRKVI